MSVRFDVLALAKAAKPRRALLYAPSHVTKMLHKGASLKNLDTLAFDLEDGVPLGKKEEARRNVLSFMHRNPKIIPELAIRINSAETQDGMQDLQEVVLSKEVAPRIKAVIVPKVERGRTVKAIEWFLRTNNLSHVEILAMIETPLGLAKVNKIASSSKALTGLIFGSEDYRSASGITREFGDEPILAARSAIVTAARGYNLQAIDMTSLDFRRSSVVEEDCRRTRALGFTGKQVIHPMQIEHVNNAFMLRPEDIKKREEMIREFVKTQLIDGRGVYGNNGEMVELPHVKDAVRELLASGKTMDEIQSIADSVLRR